jgi:hypothetical protein
MAVSLGGDLGVSDLGWREGRSCQTKEERLSDLFRLTAGVVGGLAKRER